MITICFTVISEQLRQVGGTTSCRIRKRMLKKIQMRGDYKYENSSNDCRK